MLACLGFMAFHVSPSRTWPDPQITVRVGVKSVLAYRPFVLLGVIRRMELVCCRQYKAHVRLHFVTNLGVAGGLILLQSFGAGSSYCHNAVCTFCIAPARPSSRIDERSHKPGHRQALSLTRIFPRHMV